MGKGKNWLIVSVVRFFLAFRSRKSIEKGGAASYFLIISTTGLGDTLWATPALRSLAHSFPHSQIGVMTSEIGREVLAGNPYISDLFVLKKPYLVSLLSLFVRLQAKQITAVLVFHASQRIIFPFAALLPALQVVGVKGMHKGLDALCTDLIEPQQEHEIDKRLRLVAAVGAKRSSSALLEMHISKVSRERGLQYIETIHNNPRPLIGLHPGAKNLFKRWPAENFIELGQALEAQLGAQILISGDRSEEILTTHIASNIPGALPLAGSLSIQEFGAILQKMALFISNDTGTMHMASALKVPLIALFGPTDAAICGPLRNPITKIIQTQKSCFTCLGKQCQDPFCLRQIGPEAVLQQALFVYSALKVY